MMVSVRFDDGDSPIPVANAPFTTHYTPTTYSLQKEGVGVG